MSTNQALRDGIYEGILYIFLQASEAMVAGDVVELDPASGYPYVRKCPSSGTPFGFAAQTVTAAGVEQWELNGFITHTAKVGDHVGVYINGGVYNHKDATAATWGAELYAGTSTAGKLATSSASSGKKVGICVKAKDATTAICKVKSYL
jgi:hypothetical protein